MADQSATRQSAGTEPNGVPNERSAIEAVSRLLDAENGATGEQERAPAKATRTPAVSSEDDDGAAEQGPEAQSDEDDTGESTELEADEGTSEESDESDAYRDSIEELAKVMEIEPEELAKRLTVPVKIKGKETRVSLIELQNGYQRGGDYAENNKQLARQREALKEQEKRLGEQMQQKIQELSKAIKTAEGYLSQGPSEEEMLRLLNEDPTEYVRQEARQKLHRQRLDALKAEHDKAVEGEIQKHAKEMAERRKSEQDALLSKMPHLSDPQKLSKFEQNVTAYLKDSDFTGEEIEGFFRGAWDHRQLMLINDAMRFRAANQGKGELMKKLEKKPKMTSPGPSSQPKKGQERLAAQLQNIRNLSRSPSNRGRAEQAAKRAVADALKQGL